MDLAWLLSGVHGILPFSYDVTIDRYRVELAARLGGRFDQSWWQPQLELALLGELVRGAWFLMHRLTTDPSPNARAMYRAQLDWWCGAFRRGLKWL